MALPEAAHFGGAKKSAKNRPLVPPLIDGRPMFKAIRFRAGDCGTRPCPRNPMAKAKQTLEEEEGQLEDGVLDKGTSDRV